MSRRGAIRVIIAGGGTGGHLFPGIAVAQAFQAHDPAVRILFIGPGKPMEKAALGRAGFRHLAIDVEGIKRRGARDVMRAVAKLFPAFGRCGAILRRFRPHVVIGMGGYSAGPVIAAARLMGYPAVVAEQNIAPGITTRLLAPLAHRIYVSFPDTPLPGASARTRRKIRVTGNPVRPEILKPAGAAASPPEGGGPAFTALVLGGSQGARAINRAMADAAGRLAGREGLRIIHQTGAHDGPLVTAAYAAAGIAAEVAPFFEAMGPRYAAADLIICRAGATTVAEVTALGKPAIFIPFPFAADDHQMKNAAGPAAAGAAERIAQADATGARLAGRIGHYMDHPEALARMARQCRAFGRPDAARAIVQDCLALMGRGGKAIVS